MKSIRLLAQARQELRDAAEYYERRSIGLGVDFTRKVDRAISAIRETPECWPVIRKNIRRQLISRFPYCLLYKIDSDQIIVLAVMHLRQRPGYWIGR